MFLSVSTRWQRCTAEPSFLLLVSYNRFIIYNPPAALSHDLIITEEKTQTCNLKLHKGEEINVGADGGGRFLFMSDTV